MSFSGCRNIPHRNTVFHSETILLCSQYSLHKQGLIGRAHFRMNRGTIKFHFELFKFIKPGSCLFSFSWTEYFIFKGFSLKQFAVKISCLGWFLSQKSSGFFFFFFEQWINWQTLPCDLDHWKVIFCVWYQKILD